MRLSKIFLPVILTCAFTSPTVAQAKPVFCDLNREDASELKKVISLANLGIKIRIPVNFRTIARQDSSITITDEGTFKFFQCLAQNSKSWGGTDDYYSINIFKSEHNYLSGNVVKELPNKPGFFIFYENNIDFHTVKLKIKTRKGILEVDEFMYGGGPITTKEEAITKVKELVDLAKDIEII